MGPRHFSRGSSSARHRDVTDQLALQWGHGISAVEVTYLEVGYLPK